MALDPKVRSAGLHLGTAAASAMATAMWMASHQVDLYAIVDQFNAVVKSLMTLLTTVSVFAGGAWQVWKSTTGGLVSDVNEIAKQPDSPVKAVITENNPEGRALAASIPGPVLPAGSDAAERIVKN